MKIIANAPEAMNRIFYERDEKKKKKLDAARRRVKLSKIVKYSAYGQVFAFVSGISCCLMGWSMANKLHPFSLIVAIFMIANLIFSYLSFAIVEKKIEDFKWEELR